MSTPLVSILIPSYKPKYFDFTLRSVLSQSYKNIEIIVSDDCPDNSIKEIVDRYNSIISIKYVKNPNPDGLGTTNCINCMHLAQGEYVKFLFDDDVIMPFAVQYMVETFITYESINPRLVVSERWFIDAGNRYCGTNRLPTETATDITNFADFRYMAITRMNKLGEFSTAMWRREDSFDSDGTPLFAKLNGLGIDGLTDVAMWINLAERGRVLYIPLPLSCFRRHAESNTVAMTGFNHHKIYTDWEIVIDQALALNRITELEALGSYKELLLEYRKAEDRIPSLRCHAERLELKVGKGDSYQ